MISIYLLKRYKSNFDKQQSIKISFQNKHIELKKINSNFCIVQFATNEMELKLKIDKKRIRKLSNNISLDILQNNYLMIYSEYQCEIKFKK